MLRHKVPENHQDMKFWPNLHSFKGKLKITLFHDDPVTCLIELAAAVECKGLTATFTHWACC